MVMGIRRAIARFGSQFGSDPREAELADAVFALGLHVELSDELVDHVLKMYLGAIMCVEGGL